MTKEPVANTYEKFFFNQNIFDEDHEVEDEILEEEPPPPVFSEAELEAEKKSAFQEGYAKATEEERNSRSQNLANLMQTLAQDMSTLFVREADREARYEEESVRLTLNILQKLYPHYAQEHDFNALKNVLESVIRNHNQKQIIQIRVTPDMVEGVQSFMEKLQNTNPELRLNVQGDENLQGTACKLSWDDGGVLHDTKAMAQEILEILKDGLAGKRANSHDEKDVQQCGPDEAPVTDLESGRSDMNPDTPDPEEKLDE